MERKHWIIAYQVSRNDQTTWQVFNDVFEEEDVLKDPTDWLIDFLRKKEMLGYTNVVLLSSCEITASQYLQLINMLE